MRRLAAGVSVRRRWRLFAGITSLGDARQQGTDFQHQNAGIIVVDRRLTRERDQRGVCIGQGRVMARTLRPAAMI